MVFHDFLTQPLKNRRKIKVFGPWGPGPRAQGCASRARTPRDPKGPQITPFCHQLGRHTTVFGRFGAEFRRIPARISPDRSHPLNLNSFFHFFGPVFWEKCDFLTKYSLSPTYQQGLKKQAPCGSPRAPPGPPQAPRGSPPFMAWLCHVILPGMAKPEAWKRGMGHA